MTLLGERHRVLLFNRTRTSARWSDLNRVGVPPMAEYEFEKTGFTNEYFRQMVKLFTSARLLF